MLIRVSAPEETEFFILPVNEFLALVEISEAAIVISSGLIQVHTFSPTGYSEIASIVFPSIYLRSAVYPGGFIRLSHISVPSDAESDVLSMP
jgi:hypothetical protein